MTRRGKPARINSDEVKATVCLDFEVESAPRAVYNTRRLDRGEAERVEVARRVQGEGGDAVQVVAREELGRGGQGGRCGRERYWSRRSANLEASWLGDLGRATAFFPRLRIDLVVRSLGETKWPPESGGP